MLALQQTLTYEKSRSSGHQSELEKERIKIQKLKAERNNYKQKNESLLKEINRVCKNGKYSIRDVEKIVMDAAVCQEEIALFSSVMVKGLLAILLINQMILSVLLH